MSVNYMLLNTSVVLDYDEDGVGIRVNIPKDDKRYDEIEQAIKDGELGLIPEIVSRPVAEFEGEDGVEVQNGIVHVDGLPIPTLLNARMMAQREEGFNIGNLMALWGNLKENPSFRARQFTFDFLDHHQVPITEDGCFIAYKKITNDWKDCYTQLIDNSIGQVVKMDRRLVDDDPRSPCSVGLHAASWEYAEGFANGRVVAVKVNPRDVVCVPFDYNGQKMRICEYEVLREMEVPEKKSVWTDSEPMMDEDSDEFEEEICSTCGESDHDQDECPDNCDEEVDRWGY